MIVQTIKRFFTYIIFYRKNGYYLYSGYLLVHMAGTMNKKTFLFLPKVPDYRWGLKNNQEWYPSVSLLRQEKLSDWKKPIKDCQKIIKEFLSGCS